MRICQTVLRRRLLLIYGGSVLALFAVASAFRLLMAAAGMKTH
ncbi:DUF2474 domain-containing protein (plasmid) [Klebsiella pneumoniae]